MENIVYKPLDMKKINNKKSLFVSTEEALSDVSIIEWDDEVLNGNKKVILVDER